MLFLLAGYLTCPDKHLSVALCTCRTLTLFLTLFLNPLSHLPEQVVPSCAEDSLPNPHSAMHSFLCCTSVTHLPAPLTHARHPPLQTGLVSHTVFLSGNCNLSGSSQQPLLLSTPLSFLLCSLFTPLSEVPKVTPQLQFSGVTIRHIYGLLCVQTCPQTPVQLLLC